MGALDAPEQAETLDREPVLGQFHPTRQDRWVFGDRDSGAHQVRYAWTTIVRHPLVKGAASPDDPALARYWADRRRKKAPPPLDKRGLRLLKAQHGRCPACRDFLLHADHEPQNPREWEQWLALTRKAIYHQWITPEATTIGNTAAACHAIAPNRQRNGDSATPAMNVARAIALLNSGLRGYRVSRNAAGEVEITQNFVELPPDPQQQALADRLEAVITDPHTTLVSISAGSRTVVGSYNTADFDILDIERLGVGALIHEIEEQYQRQAKMVAYGSETTGAHAAGIAAESAVTGATRGAQKVVSATQHTDGTLDAVVEIPFTSPAGTVRTMVMRIVRSNVTSVTWK